MRHRMAATIVAVVAAIALPVQNAQAYDAETLAASCGDRIPDNGEPWESLCYRQPATHPATFVLVGPRAAWGIRYVARFVDRRIDGLRIYRRHGLTCESYPDAVCVNVRPGDFGPTGWSGRWQYSTPIGQVIELNAYYRPRGDTRRQRTAGHELMHAMGFAHHIAVGIVGKYDGYDTPRYPTPVEIDVLRAWYDQPVVVEDVPEPQTPEVVTS